MSPHRGINQLPAEMLDAIIRQCVNLHRCEKNSLLPLRLVCKYFDMAVRKFLFKTIQLEFTRFTRTSKQPDLQLIKNFGCLSEALYCDMMVIRDEDEINRLQEVFASIIPKVPEMTDLLDSLRQYCMNDNTFNEDDFVHILKGVLDETPNLVRLKLNLPFQVIGRASRTATILLANTFHTLYLRPAEFQNLQILVLDHVSDASILDICRNPQDRKYALHVFKHLKSLVLSIKRQEYDPPLMGAFSEGLWSLISGAEHLETLCLIGWNTKRPTGQRRTRTTGMRNEWAMKSLPVSHCMSTKALKHLRCLELKRVDIEPDSLIYLIKQCSTSLKELYLNDVYLKIEAGEDLEVMPYWIGYGAGVAKSRESCWIAEKLKDIDNINLDIIRATGLGYDIFDPLRIHVLESYDFFDAQQETKPFDQRFVETFQGALPQSQESEVDEEDSAPWVPPSDTLPAVEDLNHLSLPLAFKSQPLRVRKSTYDAHTFQRYYHNTTSCWKRSIDGYFYNHNEKALLELQKIISVADHGMGLLSEEINRMSTLTGIPL